MKPQPADSAMPSSTSTPKAEELETTQEERERERDEAIRLLSAMCGREGADPDSRHGDGVRGGTRPLRIVILGKPGTGKSAFVNGVIAALSEDRYREYSYTGYWGQGEPITIVSKRFVGCNNGDRLRFKGVYLPTLIDVAGLPDEEDDILEETLRLLFYGHIQEDDSVMTVYNNCRKSSIPEIRCQYDYSYPQMRIDRVVFVASAADLLPDRLMSCVHRAARPSHDQDLRRALPIYGVLTKMDKVDTSSASFLNLKKKFMTSLGLNRDRLLVCQNYCDDTDPNDQRTQRLDPVLDLPYIRFMQRLCDSALNVSLEDEPLQQTEIMSQTDLVKAFFVALLAFVLVHYFGPSAKSMCQNGSTEDSLCRADSPWVGMTVMVHHVLWAVGAAFMFLVWRYIKTSRDKIKRR